MVERIVKFISAPITPEASYFKFIWPFVVIISIPHELCHWVTARILGIHLKLTLMAVISEDDLEIEAWKYILIVLAPSFVGLLVYIYLLSISLFVWETKPIVLMTIVAIIWQRGCRADYADVLSVFRGTIQ